MAHDTHNGGHDHHDEGPHSTMSGYMIGFILSVILTVIPFWLVMSGTITNRNTGLLVLGGLAVAQIVVHLVYFLHVNGKIEAGWTMLSTIFTVVILGIAVAGTVWVMYHMNKNMMPTHPNHAVIQQATP